LFQSNARPRGACVITIYHNNQTFVLTQKTRTTREKQGGFKAPTSFYCSLSEFLPHDARLSSVSSSGCPQLKCTDSSQKQLGVYFVDTASAPRPQMARKPMKAPLFGALGHLMTESIHISTFNRWHCSTATPSTLRLLELPQYNYTIQIFLHVHEFDAELVFCIFIFLIFLFTFQ